MPLHVLKIECPRSEPRLFHHRGTRADAGVIQQIFENRDYSLERFARGDEIVREYESIRASGRKALVLDAGANIGASVVYFSVTYPGVHIVALEPDTGNFELMLRNIEGLDVDARCAAIAATSQPLYLFDPGEGEWGYRAVKDAVGAPVEVCVAARLVEEKVAAGYVPLIAKIDIEGGEQELFSGDLVWVDAFPLLIIELHDWLLPRSGSSRNFLRCMAERDRDFVQYGENIFSFRNGPSDIRHER